MYFIAWNGEIWSKPFRPCDLISDTVSLGGLNDKDGCSISWDADGFRGENWVRLSSEMQAEMNRIAPNPTTL